MGSSNDKLRSFLAGLFRTAVSAAHPTTCLPPLLPALPSGRLILLAAGKAAGSMAETAEAHYLDQMRIGAERLTGVAVTRQRAFLDCRRVDADPKWLRQNQRVTGLNVGFAPHLLGLA